MILAIAAAAAFIPTCSTRIRLFRLTVTLALLPGSLKCYYSRMPVSFIYYRPCQGRGPTAGSKVCGRAEDSKLIFSGEQGSWPRHPSVVSGGLSARCGTATKLFRCGSLLAGRLV